MISLWLYSNQAGFAYEGNGIAPNSPNSPMLGVSRRRGCGGAVGSMTHSSPCELPPSLIHASLKLRRTQRATEDKTTGTGTLRTIFEGSIQNRERCVECSVFSTLGTQRRGRIEDEDEDDL